MDSSKWRDHASTRARSERTSLFWGSVLKAARSVEAARSKSFRSLASRATRSASSEAVLCASADEARSEIAKRTAVPSARRLRLFGFEPGRALLITGIHSLEKFTDESGRLLDSFCNHRHLPSIP